MKHNAYVAITFAIALIPQVYARAQQQAANDRIERVLTLPPSSDIKRLVSVSGTVISDATGAPIAGALVRLALTRSETLFSILRDKTVNEIEPVLTDAAGRFEFLQVEEGPYDLAVAKRQYKPIPKAQNANGTPLVLRAGARLDPILIRLSPAASIEGRVTAGTGTPLPDVRIELFEIGGLSAKGVDVTTSASDGYYAFDGPTPGYYVVQSTSQTGSPLAMAANAITIPANQTSTLNISVPAGERHDFSGQFVSMDAPKGTIVNWRLKTERLSYPAGSNPDSSIDRDQTFSSTAFKMESLQPGLYRFVARGETNAGVTMCGLEDLLVNADSAQAVKIPMYACDSAR